MYDLQGNSWRVLVDDKYSCNENALRFDPNSEELTGKKLHILEEVLMSMERTMMERVAQTPLPAMRKEFATQSVLQRIQTSQHRARSRQMHHMYSQHLQGGSKGGTPQKDGAFFPQGSPLAHLESPIPEASPIAQCPRSVPAGDDLDMGSCLPSPSRPESQTLNPHPKS